MTEEKKKLLTSHEKYQLPILGDEDYLPPEVLEAIAAKFRSALKEHAEKKILLNESEMSDNKNSVE